MFKKSWILPLFSLSLIVLTFIVFKSVLSYIIISGVLALLTRPLYKKIKNLHLGKYRLSKGLSSITTILVFYSILLSLIMIFIPAVAKEVKVITQISPSQALKAIQEPIEYIESSLNRFTDKQISVQNYVTEKFTSLINVSAISSWINKLTAFTGNLFISFFAVTFITFFFLKDSKVIMENIYKIIPFGLRNDTDDVLIQVKYKLTRYFIGLCIEILLVFTINALGLYAIGIKNFLIIAFFAGLINVIPYIGPLIGILFGLLIVVTTNYNLDIETVLPLLSYTAVIMIATQLLDNLIFQPYIYSNSVNAHPLEIFLVILITGNLYGIVGMMLAIPAYSVARVIIKEARGNSKILEDIYKPTE